MTNLFDMLNKDLFKSLTSLNGLNRKISLLLLFFLPTGCGVEVSSIQKEGDENQNINTKEVIHEKMKVMGHRNWILLVDSAFPEQNADGMETIVVEGGMLENLEWLLPMIKDAPHINPVIYKDLELDYLDEDMVAGIEGYKSDLNEILGDQIAVPLLHEEIFEMLDKEASLFSILMIKTDEVMPYTSLFMQLDCGYWNPDQEAELRKKMSEK
ncbi:MAG: hypothetical protein WD398_15100 [Cyclobacteriaceae bacterium]